MGLVTNWSDTGLWIGIGSLVLSALGVIFALISNSKSSKNSTSIENKLDKSVFENDSWQKKLIEALINKPETSDFIKVIMEKEGLLIFLDYGSKLLLSLIGKIVKTPIVVENDNYQVPELFKEYLSNDTSIDSIIEVLKLHHLVEFKLNNENGKQFIQTSERGKELLETIINHNLDPLSYVERRIKQQAKQIYSDIDDRMVKVLMAIDQEDFDIHYYPGSIDGLSVPPGMTAKKALINYIQIDNKTIHPIEISFNDQINHYIWTLFKQGVYKWDDSKYYGKPILKKTPIGRALIQLIIDNKRNPFDSEQKPLKL